MKATFNGALQLSVLDGWWAEAYDGDERLGDPERRRRGSRGRRRAATPALFYDLLEQEVIPLFYDRDAAGVPHGWCERIKQALVTLAPDVHRDPHGRTTTSSGSTEPDPQG